MGLTRREEREVRFNVGWRRWSQAAAALVWTAVVVIIAGQFTACTPALRQPIEFATVTEYEPPGLRALVDPTALVAGDPAPDDGYLLTPEEWRRVRDEVSRLESALLLAYQQRESDRLLAETEDAAKLGQLQRCGEGRRRAEVAVAACAAGTVVAGGIAVGVGTR